MELLRGEEPLGFEQARLLEKNGEYKAAARAYEKLLKKSTKKIKILERLMVVYRKLNELPKEVKSIDEAIKIYTQQYPVKKSADRKLSSLSKQLNSLLGHTDKKGKNMLVPPEILKLEVRKNRLLKKVTTPRKKK